MAEIIAARYVYGLVVVLLAVGLYGILVPRNLVKKVIGMTIFHTAIYVFFIEGSVKHGATVPVIHPDIGPDPAAYVNPLPHLLILTAIVVGVGVLGVALSLLIRLYRTHGTLDEDRILANLSPPADHPAEAEGRGR